MNHRELLVKYMAHVIMQESYDFLPLTHTSAEEDTELDKLAAEASALLGTGWPFK